MRMSRHKNVGFGGLYHPYRLGGVVAWITADMGYQHPLTFALKAVKLVIDASHNTTIDIAIDSFQRFECRYLVGQSQRAEVAGVPNFINVFQKLTQWLVKRAVSIGYYTYAFHCL